MEYPDRRLGSALRTCAAIIHARIGVPVPAAELLDGSARRRERAMHTVGYLIADALPEEYRGSYDGSDERLAEARQLADELSAGRR